jgi:Chalcone isomerase-like
MYLYRTWENAQFNRHIAPKSSHYPLWRQARLLALFAWLPLAGMHAVSAQAQAQTQGQAQAQAQTQTQVQALAPTQASQASQASPAPASKVETSTITVASVDDSSAVRVGLPGAQLAGSAKLTVWGFDVYRASLWVTPGFRQTRYAEHAFALELAYLRKFDANAITQRTLDEMQRQTKLPPEKVRAWREAMLSIFPDVKPGDRITGIHQPGAPTRFLVNGKPKGEIVDDEFDRLFFGIWLSDATSEPALRQALVAQTQR